MSRGRNLKDTIAPCGTGESGALLIELIFVMPIVLFLLGYILRLTMHVQANLIAMNLSREIATDAFRRCADYSILTKVKSGGDDDLKVDTTASAPLISACLQGIKTRIKDNWSVLRPIGSLSTEPSLSLAVYRYNFPELASCAPPDTNCNCNQPTTKITDDGTGDSGQSTDFAADVICQRNRIVKVQLSFTITPISAFLNLLPGAYGATTPSGITISEEAII